MSYSKLIHEYLDSQLNAVNEDVLFAELAKNSDLRVEFNQQVQLQNVAMTDMRTITPPAESTNAIFTSLGFTIPSSDYLRRIMPNSGGSISMRPAGSAVSQFFRKYASTVAAVIITASLTTAVFMLTDNRFATTPTANENIAQVKKDIPVVSSQEKSDIAIVKQSNLTNITRTQRNTFANISDNSANQTQQIVDDNSPNIAGLFQNSPSVKTNSSDEPTINLMGTNSNTRSGFVNNDVYDPFFSALNIEPAQNFNDGNVAVIFSYSDQASNVSVAAPGQSFAGNNFNVTTLYKINDHWYVGASFGAEQFALKYTQNIKGEGEGYQWQQMPSLGYIGLTTRFALPLKDYFEYGDLITPYLQIFGGTTNAYGFLAKGQAGITLTPYNKLAINIGYEIATYSYKIEKTENIFKNGFVFGAGLSF